MLKVRNEVPTYEVDGREKSSVDGKPLVVDSHWNRNEFVRLKYGEADITVCARDLQAAIANAINTARF